MSKKGFVFEWTSLIIRHFVLGNCMQVLNETSEDIWKSKWTFALTNRFLNYVLVTHCIISFQAIENSTQNKKVRISSFLKIRPSFALWPNSRSPSWQIVILSNVELNIASLAIPSDAKKIKSPLNSNRLFGDFHIYFSASGCHSSDSIQRYLIWLVLTLTHAARGNTSYMYGALQIKLRGSELIFSKWRRLIHVRLSTKWNVAWNSLLFSFL